MSADHEKIVVNTGPQYPHSPSDYNNNNQHHSRNDSVSALGSEVGQPQHQQQPPYPNPYPQGPGSEAQFQYPEVTGSTDPQFVQTSRDFSSPPQPQPQQHLQHPLQSFNQHQQQHQHQHQPPMAQQQLHPTAYGQQGGEWQASLCDCSPCSSCLLGWCLPCILVGQTSERIRDPSMQNADLLNSDCLIHGAITCFTGCGWIYSMLKRGEIRERYNIQGSGCNDCCVSYWCSCCAVIQQDNEVKIRQRNAQPVHQGYTSQPGMEMPAPVPVPSPAYTAPEK